MAATTTLRLNARPTEPTLPALLRSSTRAAGAAGDPFLPADYLRPLAAYDLSPAARGAADAGEHSLDARDDEVLVIELTDGSTLVTSAQRLRESLRRSRPELVTPQGEILFERLRAEGADITAAASRGFVSEAIGGFVTRVFALAAGERADAIIEAARRKLGGDAASLGVSWAGTKALMWAIESKLDREPGLYRWTAAAGEARELQPAGVELVEAAASSRPVLVFVHGTGSSSMGSFGELHAGDRGVWSALERHYTGGIYAFEHRTLSESPIDNALQLARALPPGTRLSLVTHSRGGLVGDLVSLADFDALIDGFRHELPGIGEADAGETRRVLGELDEAHAEHRERLRELAAELRARQFVVQRYVRVASPAQGTRLASGNFDVFLSGVLTLIGQVPFFFGSPLYSAFKRVVIEIAKNRTNPHLVPGIEAMLPDSPMARLLRDAPVREGVQMAVIAGDVEGGHLLKRLGVLLTDFLLFDNLDNDLVVDTAAMLAGIAPQANARALFDRGADVSHFRYFVNGDTRSALRDWLVSDEPGSLGAYRRLPARFEELDSIEEDERLARVARSRGVSGADLPVVVMLPGIMGSHLWRDRSDRVWFDPVDLAFGGLAKIAWGKPNVEAEKLFGMIYGDLAEHLAATHRALRFPYDWRQPLDVLAERLGEYLDQVLKETTQPVRLLAHSMGGLVVRACIHKRRSVMDGLMKRDGARFVMLGTPNQGAYSMVENLLGKGGTLRKLVRTDVKHDLQDILDIVSGFRGALQLLPKPGFVDTFQGDPEGGESHDFQDAQTWPAFKRQVRDFWFGDGRVGTPSQAVLDEGSWLWKQDGSARPALPPDYETKSIYVYGVAPTTPCGIRVVREGDEAGRMKMVGTPSGDGTVTWESGRIDHVGSHYYMPVEHGDLPSTAEHFDAIVELLSTGATRQLAVSPPVARAAVQARPVLYDAGPPTLETPQVLARNLVGASGGGRAVPRPKRRLEVAVRTMDLRFLSQPVMVGHYQLDPIAGPQALIDRELLDGELSQRHSLGLYAGPRGTATVVLRAPNVQERQRGSLTGAIVTGLGAYDGALSITDLTESIRTGALRYLLHVVDVLGRDEREVGLATLLIGYNSSANLTVEASVEALVKGVMEANHRFSETTRLDIGISRLDIVELYQDTAITAVYALRQTPDKLGALARRLKTTLVCRPQLDTGEGMRQRLFDRGSQSYWPRLMVTDADSTELQGSAFGATPASSPGGPADGPASRPGPAPRTVLATRLKFLYVGQRARAESIVQQRQPGLVESLVRQQIHLRVYQEDFGRMLFQLMVPHDFKDAARQLERVVLVVDRHTANLPWELMLAEDPARGDERLPMAVRTPVVRQLASLNFRRLVRQGMERTALVIGNPSVDGFTAAFPDPANPQAQDPPALEGAQAEAESVARVLSGLGYRVLQAIGSDRKASDVLALLYRAPYRIVHVSAHGVFDLPHADGGTRTGVVLSDGLLVTAAEIASMETVPELVFLNCCHLGQLDAATAEDRTVREANKLAASVARELIEIGVRCVVVAGWAVDDAGAQCFGEVFYRHLLHERQPFGEAVHAARKAVWERNPEDITWGAFQAYGEPGWLAEPRLDGGGGGAPRSGTYVSPEELLDELASVRAELSRRRGRQGERELAAHVRTIEQLLKSRCPAAWLDLPQLQSALGAAWRDLGRFKDAADAYLKAIQAEDKAGRVPIKDIEQLANVEARLGERQGNESLIRRGLARLRRLDELVSLRDGEPAAGRASLANAERSALRGSAWKRLASAQAARALKPGAKADESVEAAQAMRESLKEAVSAYREAEGQPGQARFEPYHALNRLALDSLTPWSDAAERDAALALSDECAREAAQRFRSEPGFFNAVMQPEARLVQRLLDRSLGKPGEAGDAVLEELAEAYAQALSNITVKPRDMDSVISQMCLLSRFYDASFVVDKAAGEQRAGEQRRIASRLIALAERLQPGSCRREDRPTTSGAAAAGPPSPPAGSASAQAGAGSSTPGTTADQPVTAGGQTTAAQAGAQAPSKRRASRKRAAGSTPAPSAAPAATPAPEPTAAPATRARRAASRTQSAAKRPPTPRSGRKR